MDSADRSPRSVRCPASQRALAKSDHPLPRDGALHRFLPPRLSQLPVLLVLFPKTCLKQAALVCVRREGESPTSIGHKLVAWLVLIFLRVEEEDFLEIQVTD